MITHIICFRGEIRKTVNIFGCEKKRATYLELCMVNFKDDTAVP